MKKNSLFFFIAIILVLVMGFSGCELVFPPTTYEATPTKIRYDLFYGYRVNSSGTGLYEISYWCDTPEVLVGITHYDLLYNDEYQTKTVENNTLIHWNISDRNQQSFSLGIVARVEANGYLIADLNGDDAFTIAELQNLYSNIVNQYTQVQGNETIRFIDPSNHDIATITQEIYQEAQTNNSFLLTKSLFVWLKQNIKYQTHPNEPGVQPAAITVQKKQGDCDDLSFLYVSLCRALGIPARFIRGYLLTESDNGATMVTAHAWVEVFVGGADSKNGWIPVECACCTPSIETDINQNFGIESAFHMRLFTDDGNNESLASSLLGISYVIHNPDRTITLDSFAEIHNYQILETKTLVITAKNIRQYE